MRLVVKILLAATAVAMTACRDLPDYLVSDNTVAKVGRKELKINEIMEAMPANVKGDDSVSFVKLYVDKWLVRQLKVEEADDLFSGSEEDIDRMVEEYRHSLLMRKVDQYYVEQQMSPDFTDKDIADYYNTHKADFILDRTLVKGRVLRFDASYRQSKTLMKQMRDAATSQSAAKTLSEICEKNGFELVDKRSEWVGFNDFLTYLPTAQSQDNEHLLDKTGIQQMDAGGKRYYFDFTSVCRKGNVAPLEVVADNIRRILITQRRSEIIKSHEEQIVSEAMASGHARIYADTADGKASVAGAPVKGPRGGERERREREEEVREEARREEGEKRREDVKREEKRREEEDVRRGREKERE